MAKRTIGLDIGSRNIVVYLEGRGIIVNESNRIALDINTKEAVSYGHEAAGLARRTPGSVLLMNPIFEGNISDHDGVMMILDEIFRGIGISKPEIILAIGAETHDAEKRALAAMLMELGAKNVYYINKPTACALGSDLDLSNNRSMISLNIGAGITNVGLIKGCVTRFEQSVRYGCNKLDAAVAAFLRRERGVAVSEETLSDIRKNVGSVHESFDEGEYGIVGRDLVTGLPVSLTISSAETREVMLPIAEYICKVVAALHNRLPSEVRNDVTGRGLLLSGGGALTGGIDKLLEEKTGLPVTLSPRPIDCVIDGIGVAIENREVFDVLIKEI